MTQSGSQMGHVFITAGSSEGHGQGSLGDKKIQAQVVIDEHAAGACTLNASGISGAL